MREEVRVSLQRRAGAEHVLTVLREHPGEGMRFCQIKLAMVKKGWIHCDAVISTSSRWLVKSGLATHSGNNYGGLFTAIDDP